MHRTLLILLLIALAVPAMAVGKVTVDPNAPGAVQKQAPVDVADTRLAKRVTYAEPRKTVSAILDDLAKSTGVVFRAGYNSKDWQVRDRKMTIFVKDVPLSQLMNSMARVMKFKWDRAGTEGAWTYRLYMDRRTLLDAEAQRVREEQKAEAEAARKRSEGFMKYASLGGMSDAGKAKLKTENPFLYFAATSGLGGSIGSFFQEAPMAGQAIANGQRLDLRGSALSPAAQAALVRAMQDMKTMEARFGGRNPEALPDDLMASMDKINVKLNQSLEFAKGMPQAGMLLGDMMISYDGRDMVLPFLDPNSAMAKVIGAALVQSQEEGRPLNEVMKERGSDFVAAAASEMKAEAGGEPLTEHPDDDPALKNKITLKPEGQKLADIEKALAEAAELGVVSDSFGSMFGEFSVRGQVPTTESELKDVLDKIGDVYTYNWDKRTGVIGLRDRNWFKKRAVQIPEAWLEVWRKELTDTGTIEIDSLAQIASLTQEQLLSNVAGDEVLQSGSLLGVIFGNRDLLRLYGGLSQDQRSTLMSRSGLDLAMLSESQFAEAGKIIQTKLGLELLNSGKSIAITCERKASDKPAAEQKPADKPVLYRFSLLVDGEKLDKDWSVSTPVYFAPKPKDPKSVKPAEAAKPAEAPKPATDPDAPKTEHRTEEGRATITGPDGKTTEVPVQVETTTHSGVLP